MNHEKQDMSVMQSMLYTLRMIWKGDRGCVIFSLYKNITEEVYMSFFFILMLQMIYSYIEEGKAFAGLLRFVTFFCLGHICIHIASAAHAYYIRLKTPKVYSYFFKQIINKAMHIPLAKFEEPEFYDKFARALDECLTKAMDGMSAFVWALGCALSAVAAAFIIARVDPVLILFSVPPIVAMQLFGFKINELSLKLRNLETRDKRTSEYVKRVFYEKKYASEIRLYPIRKVLLREQKESFENRSRTYRRIYKKIHLYRQLQAFFTFGLTLTITYVYVTIVVKTSGVTKIGMYVATMGSIDYLAWRVREAGQKFLEAGKNCMYMNNFEKFMNVSEEVMTAEEAEDIGNIGDMKLENVSFTYAGAKKPVISDMTLEIHKGERIALVGENGAGKTTLVKLIMGLYPLDSGSITVSGKDIKSFDRQEYHKHFGTVFQDLQIFGLPLSHNVLMREPENEQERELVTEALKKAQFGDTLAGLTDGIDTMITKEFDDNGFVCSGGQAQKIAIARVFAKNPDFVILDEPSSALDPIAEYNMYQNMLDVAAGKTVLFISHRLSSARIADRILFLENGRIVENGTHDELMEKNGRYAEMFKLQAGNYVE